ncbi:MAG: hypothetical protein DWQ34_22325 [Planctomycetota bacterium]|nr:MAG: hypothetical protein DWQ29_15460 [Planctomycetota bacterium]REJ88434.1 MAG: hypothetical protein DWQ34_22325 [Planctomycetota bacterium]REK24855.1 MAG: hypothetical protein DWQ41_13040 [Planctomycetota bacterium]REK40136.1 MAG: hypothetical protein DWQ45_00845 [Planctomycetota bacterium]
MLRSIVGALKQLLYAVLVLIAGLCAAEVTLRAQRVQRHLTTADLRSHSAQAAYVAPSDQTFQQLAPLSKFLVTADDGEEFILETNSFGLRGPEVTVPKPGGVFRVICLGDETTLAAALPAEQTYCERLEEYLQARTQLRVEVVNAGLPHGCPLSSYLLLKQRLIGLQPDVVLLHIDPTDVQDDLAIRPFTWMDADGRPLAAVHPAAGKPHDSSLARLSDEFAVLDWLREHGIRLWQEETAGKAGRSSPVADRADSSQPEAARIAQTLAPVLLVRDVAAGAYAEFIISSARDPFGKTTWSLADYSQEQSLTHVDAASLLTPSTGDDPGEAGIARLNVVGHDRYAAALAEAVMNRVAGIWTEPPPSSIPTLPDIARTPAQ